MQFPSDWHFAMRSRYHYFILTLQLTSNHLLFFVFFFFYFIDPCLLQSGFFFGYYFFFFIISICVFSFCTNNYLVCASNVTRANGLRSCAGMHHPDTQIKPLTNQQNASVIQIVLHSRTSSKFSKCHAV